MASILRSGKFIRHFAGFARSLVINNTSRETESNIFQRRQLCGTFSQ